LLLLLLLLQSWAVASWAKSHVVLADAAGAVSTRAAARFVRGAVRKLCAIVYANCGQSKVRDSIVRTR
jgi:hypothetical protein